MRKIAEIENEKENGTELLTAKVVRAHELARYANLPP